MTLKKWKVEMILTDDFSDNPAEEYSEKELKKDIENAVENLHVTVREIKLVKVDGL